jgi:hypothetical protein
LVPGHNEIDWSPDGKTIAFAAKGKQGFPAIFLHLAVLDKPPFWVAATADGKSVIFDQPGQEESHVMLLENFG